MACGQVCDLWTGVWLVDRCVACGQVCSLWRCLKNATTGRLVNMKALALNKYWEYGNNIFFICLANAFKEHPARG